MEKQTLKLVLGSWWRSTKYEIEDGCLCPGGHTGQPYEPWSAYKSWRDGVEEQSEAPYQALLDIIFDERLDREFHAHLERGSEDWHFSSPVKKRIMDWCARHGLLGIIPQRVAAIYHAPTWQEDQSGTLVPHIVSFQRTAGTWAEVHLPVPKWTSFLNKDAATCSVAKKGGLVFPEESPPGWPTAWIDQHPLSSDPDDVADVLWTGSRHRPGHPSSGWMEEFKDFFFCDPESGQAPDRFPVPLTESFWGWYREPFREFYFVARRFAWAVKNLVLKTTSGEGGSSSAPDQRASSGFDFLAALAQTAGPCFIRDGEVIRQGLFSPSLLSSYALMVLQDMEPFRLIFICPGCGRVFTSRAHRVSYCSPTCRNRLNKRKSRAMQQRSE